MNIGQIDTTNKGLEQLDDTDLLKFIRQGNSHALDLLIQRYISFVRGKARTYFLVGADKEDIIQEGMIGLYKAIRDYDVDKLSSFKAFAELCVTRQIIILKIKRYVKSNYKHFYFHHIKKVDKYKKSAIIDYGF